MLSFSKREAWEGGDHYIDILSTLCYKHCVL